MSSDNAPERANSLRVCISGTGFAGDFTARAFGAIPHKNGVTVELAGVTSGHLGNAQRFAARHGVGQSFDNHKAMLGAVKPHIDCIACANHAHAQYVIEAAEAGVPVIVLEKPPLIWPGYPMGREADPETRALESMELLDAMLEAVEANGVKLLYAENFVYVDGMRAMVELLGTAQAVGKGHVLLQQGVCAHQGSHAPDYDNPEKSGGGALFNKACHPLGAALYLKQVEGILRNGRPIRPVSVSGFTLQVLKGMPAEAGEHFRVMQNVEDFGRLSVVFEDGTLAELLGHDLSISGIRNAFSVTADFGQYDMRINPNDEHELFLPDARAVGDRLLREKLPTPQGTSFPRPMQMHAHGYVQEISDAVDCALNPDRYPQSGPLLAWDTMAVLMTAYVSSADGGTLLPLLGDTQRRFPPEQLPFPATGETMFQRP